MERRKVIYSRFNDNDAALNSRFQIDSLSKEWIEKRIDIFFHYTRKSFELQTNQEFLAVLRTHPSSIDLVKSALKNYPKINDNILFTSTPKEDIKKYILGADEFYLAQIDSDDMYHPGYMQLLTEFDPKLETSVIICQNGFIYDIHTKQLCQFNNISSAVYAQRFLVIDYLNTYQYFPELSHVTMYRFPYEAFPKDNFMIITHNTNTHTNVNPYTRFEITDSDVKEAILKEFHIIEP